MKTILFFSIAFYLNFSIAVAQSNVANSDLTLSQKSPDHDPGKFKNKSKNKTTLNINLSAENYSGVQMPEEFLQSIINIESNFLDSKGMCLFVNDSGNIPDYNVTIMFESVKISSNRTDMRRTTETGFIHGMNCTNRTVSVSCELTEFSQLKNAHFEGVIVFYAPASKKTVKSYPFSVENEFKYSYYNADGDTKALSGLSISNISKHPSPIQFPSDNELLVSSKAQIQKTLVNILMKKSASFSVR